MKLSKCKECGKEFEKVNKLSPYCTIKCNLKADRERKRLKAIKDK